MPEPHFEIFDPKRLVVFRSLAKLLKRGWFLTGGTALALQIGHRKSFDFDFSLPNEVDANLLFVLNERLTGYKIRPVVNTMQELSVILDEEIKLSFFKFPFRPLHEPIAVVDLEVYSCEDLASNKAYVIGRRGEWKDYVDLYFLMIEGGIPIGQIVRETKERFGGNFDEKLFWEQLVYWKDLPDFKIEYVNDAVAEGKIQRYFEGLARNKFS